MFYFFLLLLLLMLFIPPFVPGKLHLTPHARTNLPPGGGRFVVQSYSGKWIKQGRDKKHRFVCYDGKETYTHGYGSYTFMKKLCINALILYQIEGAVGKV